MSLPKTSTLKRNIALFFFSLFILLTLIVALSNQLIRWYIPYHLDGLGIKAQLETVHISWFDGQLRIEGFSTQSSPKQRLAVNKVALSWSWQGIMSNQFALSDIHVDGLRLDVHSSVDDNGGNIQSIGPYTLPTTKADNEDTTKSASDWSLNLNNILLSDIDSCYYQGKNKPLCVNWQQLNIASSINASSQSLPTLNGTITIEKLSVVDLLDVDKIDLNELNFADNQLKWAKVQVNKLSLNDPNQGAAVSAQQITLTQGNVDINNQQARLNLQQLALNQATIALNNHDIPVSSASIAAFSVNNIVANVNEQTATVSDLNLTELTANTDFNNQQQPLSMVDAITINQLSADGKKLTANLDQLAIKNVKVWQLSKRQQFDLLLDLQQLSLQSANGTANAQQFSQLNLNNLRFLQDLTAEKQQMLVNLNSLNINQAKHGDSIDINTIALTGVNSNVVYQQDDGLNLAGWLAKDAAPKPNEKEQKPEQEQQPAKPINITAISIGDNSQVAISENTTGTLLQHTLSDIEVKVRDVALNSKQSQTQNILVDLSATLNQTGKLSATGNVNPDKDALKVDIDGKIKHLNLTEFSAYSAQHTGYRVDQGQLNSDISVKIDKNKIDSNFDLLLNKFDLSQLQQHEKNQAHKELGIPLATALNLLKDSDNNIALSIPISGDVDNPQFSAADVISTVSLKAIKSAVLLTYSPLGFVTIASGVVDLATAMRFKPITFTPQQITLTDEHQKRLAQTAKVLTDKPQVSLVLCANATNNDAQAQVEPQSAEESQTPEEPQTAKETPVESLIELANQRQQAVKEYLVTQHNIEQHRLLLCNVKLDETPKPPKVSISL